MTASEASRIQHRIAQLQAITPSDPQTQAIIASLRKKLTKKYPLADTLRKVFASIWTEKAFLTREYYGIDHMKVYMGMLSHPAFADETANGVALLTARKVDGADVVDANVVAQLDDISITNPELPGAQAEQVTARIDGAGVGPISVVAHSNLTPNGGRVLSDEEAKELIRQLQISSAALKAEYGPDFGERTDLEFILGPQRQVLVKQGRPL
jgi:hypothetical protein